MNRPAKISQLDSLRGLSFLAIFTYHTIRPVPGSNLVGNFLVYIYSRLFLGIEVFFVLSAFLLTWLGLNENKQRGSFSLKNYFIRRILRIWPLYYFILAIAFLIIPLVTSRLHMQVSLPDPLWYIFFISNFYTIDHIYLLRFLWSISVEEQFYFLQGICLKFLSRYSLLIFLTLAMISIFSSCYCLLTGKGDYFNTLTYLFDFAAGGLAACILFHSKGLIRFFTRLPRWFTAVFYAYILIHFIIFYIIDIGFKGDKRIVWLVNRYLFIVYIALLIIEQIVNNNRTKFLEKNRFLRFTGKLSYGLYCYHGIVITFFIILLKKMNFKIQDFVFFSLTLLFTYLLAIVSHRYLESPFLRLKERFRNTRIAEITGAGGQESKMAGKKSL